MVSAVPGLTALVVPAVWEDELKGASYYGFQLEVLASSR